MKFERNMLIEELVKYIENKIFPVTLNEKGKSSLSVLLDEFSIEDLYVAVDIGFNNYVHFDSNGKIDHESVEVFLNKIGGIAHNNSLSPIEKKIKHIKNICNKKFVYWNDGQASTLLIRYIKLLRSNGWGEEQILDDLNGEVMEMINECNNWTQWRDHIESWIYYLEDVDISSKKDEKSFTIEKNYEIIEEKGSGSFGITYLCKDKRMNKEFIIKKFSCGMLKEEDNQKFFKKFINEIQALFDLHHQNIVSIYDFSIDEKSENGIYIMEYIDGVNIEEYLKNNKDKIVEIFKQVINAFCYLESKQLCHRDIRINNVMVNKSGEVKLIDFGFVKDISESNSVHSATKLILYPYELPLELRSSKPNYDIRTEIYFVGKLFEDIIDRLKIDSFLYDSILKNMIVDSYQKRIKSFKQIYDLMLMIDYDEIVMKSEILQES